MKSRAARCRVSGASSLVVQVRSLTNRQLSISNDAHASRAGGARRGGPSRSSSGRAATEGAAGADQGAGLRDLHSDAFTKFGLIGIQFPARAGAARWLASSMWSAPAWLAGSPACARVGWHGGHCGSARRAGAADCITCAKGQIPAFVDGGYASTMIRAGRSGVGPFRPGSCVGRCARALRRHHDVQLRYAARRAAWRPGRILESVASATWASSSHAKMGCNTVAIARGADKRAFAIELGARHYIDSTRRTSPLN